MTQTNGTPVLCFQTSVAMEITQYVSISGDGSTIALSWPIDSTNTFGMVAIFKRTGNTWNQTQFITQNRGSNGFFGTSTSLSQDGSYLAVGKSTTNTNVVIINIYQQQGSTYIQNALIPVPQFFASATPVVSLSADGTTLAIGAGGSPFTAASNGIAIALRGPNNSWTIPFARSRQGSEFNLGSAIACSADGNFVIAGAPGTNSGEALVIRPIGSFIPNDAVITGSLCIYNQTTIDSALKIAGNIHTNNTILTGTTGKVVACTANISDRRVKDTIMPLNPHDALAMIRTLKPVTFDWINPETYGPGHSCKHSTGFIAQDIEAILPHWVSNGNTIIDNQSIKTLTIKPELYAYLVAALTKLVQRSHEQNKEIDMLIGHN